MGCFPDAKHVSFFPRVQFGSDTDRPEAAKPPQAQGSAPTPAPPRTLALHPGPPALWLGILESGSPEPPAQVLYLLEWLTDNSGKHYLSWQLIVMDTNASTHKELPDTEASIPWRWGGARASKGWSSETRKLFASHCAGNFIRCYYVTMINSFSEWWLDSISSLSPLKVITL